MTEIDPRKAGIAASRVAQHRGFADSERLAFAFGAQWAVEQLPSRDEIADAMIAGNPDYKVTQVPEGERDGYLRDADAVLALIRKRFEESK